jgi:hypothetical protein
VRGTGNVRRGWLPLGVAAGQTVVVGLAAETDTALAATHFKTKTVGLAAETDTALPAAHFKTRTVGQAQETDSALAATHSRVKTVGQAQETDSALAATHRRARIVGQAQETDSALSLVPAGHVVAVGQAQEIDTALGLVPQPRRVVVGLAVETDTALAATAVKATAPPPPDTGPTGGMYEPGGDESAITGRSATIRSTRGGTLVLWGSPARVAVSSRPRLRIRLPSRRREIVPVSASIRSSRGGALALSASAAAVGSSETIRSTSGALVLGGSVGRVLPPVNGAPEAEDMAALTLLGVL